MKFEIDEDMRRRIKDALDIAYADEGDEDQATVDKLMAMFNDRIPEPVNHLDNPIFTNADRNTIVQVVMEEIQDCVKDLAHQQIADEPLVELIGYACEDSCEMASMLSKFIGTVDVEPVDGEFLRLHDDDDNYAGQLEWAKRMKLLNACEDDVTDLGREFISRWS